MSDLLEFTLQSVTANELTIKVKNSSGGSLDKTLAIETYPPAYLVSAAVNEAAIKAADNDDPPGAMRLDGLVSGPEGWSIWARRESSDSTPVIVLINDRDQKTGDQMAPPVKFPAAAEATIRIPLNAETKKDVIEFLYSYTHGDPATRYDGKLELKSSEVNWTPRVTLSTNHPTPTAIKAGDPAKITWRIEDGVSAILRGPLPGDNSELSLKPEPDADFPLAGGSLSVRVVGLMNYILQAEVKPPQGGPNVQVVKMLTLDTKNKNYTYIKPRAPKVLRYGVIELDWAAWGVERVELTACDTTRVIKLTEQTFGGSFEGNGVMRVTPTKTGTETVLIEGKPVGDNRSEPVKVITWNPMVKPNVEGQPVGLAVIAPQMALLTRLGLYIAEVLKSDPSPALEELTFEKKTSANLSAQWLALTAVGNRFVCLRRIDPSPDIEIAPFTIDGTPDLIPPINLHADLRRLATHARPVFDFVGFDERVYVVVEAPVGDGRRAYSVGFNSITNKADYRPEPLLENLPGYRLVSFDDALYALHRESGQMFRFELTKAGRLTPAMQAASAVKREGMQEQSMIKSGLIVPIGRVLVVLNPTSVPSLDSIEAFDLHNVLGYTNKKSPATKNIPQDLVYNPQKNYWSPCGRDLAIKPGAVAAFRDGDSPRLWVVQPDGALDTLAVGSESLFSRDYALNFPTKALSPYLTKKRKFTIKPFNTVGPIEEKYRRLGLTDVSTSGPKEVSPLSARPQAQFDVEAGYNQANPAPISLRMQIARSRQARPDVDHLLEVTLSGPDLSTATSCVRRVAVVGSALSNDEVFGSRTQHATDSIIEVPRPARFAEDFKFVIVNASSKFRIKTKQMRSANLLYILTTAFIMVDYEYPDFSLAFDGKISTEGEVGVNFNFAMPLGIEASSSAQPQTKLIRVSNENAKKIEVMLVKMVMPGDLPLTIQGSEHPIGSEGNKPVFVCQLDYKM